ncbi:hypothetical protein [Phytopseudomonas punonensis]|uniref:Uncharacterized protein n=1 Tax=Phytopseudomonas punonensis TaxID=1220495 RepID=A0A1M7F7F3_9GAMM|nr:hypothetical protein [Pseudomonas punonensis]SHL99903.1 hypothetical protein SAMN05216288_2786 [Pseudomonas punonensis]
MFKRSARYLLLVGLYALASVFLYLDSRSAFYLKDEELIYLVLLIIGTFVVVLPALLLLLIGMVRREPRPTWMARKYRLVGLLACLGLVVQAIPTLKHSYYKHHYGLSEQWLWSEGSENFNVLAMRGRTFCQLSTNTNVRFADVNADGFADMVLGGAPDMLYNPPADIFENCPSLGG